MHVSRSASTVSNGFPITAVFSIEAQRQATNKEKEFPDDQVAGKDISHLVGISFDFFVVGDAGEET